MSVAPGAEAGGRTAQRAAADPAASVWVSANAGAGKTAVLTDRVIRLMLEGTPPARLLCLTFTKAAAAEMENRLYMRLGGWATATDAALAADLADLLGAAPGPDDLAPARRLFAQALDAPGGLKIQTIHAFCESLLRRFPLEARIAPHFEVMDERTAAELLEAARDAMLDRVADGGRRAAALEAVVSRVDEQGFTDLVRDLAAARGRLRRLLLRHGGLDGVVAEIYEALGLAPEENRDDAVAAAVTDEAFDGAGLARAIAALARGTAKDQERAAAIAAFLESGASRAAMFDDYTAVFLTRQGAGRAEGGLITKKPREADPAALDFLLAEQRRILAVTERLKSVELAGRTAALITLGEVLLTAYEAEKRRRALLDYDDLILAARDLLQAPEAAPWVLYKLDGGLDHILVDEAQDTSPEQWQVIAELAAEFFVGEGAREDGGGPRRTVFAVGDEKQSVYSFQGADPRQFDAMRRHFEARVVAAGQDWRPVDLVLSFRSAPEVLRVLDVVFSAPEARDGVSADDRSLQHIAWRAGEPGLVELWPPVLPPERPQATPWDRPLDSVTEDSAPAQLAKQIAGQIKDWLDDGELLAAVGRPIRPGDIMILVRRRGDFADEMVRQLKLCRVPVAGTDRMVLTEQIAVMDLIALGNFLLLPDDDLTLAVVLKGPLYGLDDDDLFDLAHDRKAPLWQTLRARRGERPKLAAACDELEALLARADFVPPFEFYGELLGARGGRRRLLARLGPDAADPIGEFLALALAYERVHAPSLQGFLHWLEAGRAEIKRDLEQGRDEVRVMTVHGAKGLQAPIVFLPDTCQTPVGRHDPRLLRVAENGDAAAEAPLLLWPGRVAEDDPTAAAARAAARAATMREYRRLLYVAMSRAGDRLYICGWETQRGRAEGCWYDLMAPAVEALGREVMLPFSETGWRLGGEVAAEAAAPAAEAAAPAPEPPDWAARPAPPEPRPPRPLAPSRPVGPEPPVASPLGPDAGRRFRRGLLTHRLLEILPELEPAARRPAAERWLADPTRELDEASRRGILDEVMALLEAPRLAPLFGPGSRAEVSLSGLIGEQVVSGQVDRLAVADDRILVADYKTNRPPPEQAEQVPAVYLTQMAAYRALLRGIYPDRPIRCVLIWTDGSRLMELPDELLDRSAP